jgi:glycosyltransferase involved in cell wall biosynthesis
MRAVLNGDRLLNRFVDYPRWLRGRTQDFELFHVVDHSYSQLIHVLPCERTVVTCHDLDTFRCLLDPEHEDRPRWFRAMVRKILDGFRQAAHVITVSQSTCDQLLRHGLFAPEHVSVIPNGVHPSCSASPNSRADALAAELIPDLGNRVWLLSVGNTLPRKRLDVLLRVFASLHGELPEARLLRVGGFTSAQIELIQELQLGDAVVKLPFLERDVLAAVYRRGTLLLHTAEAEGFGLPVIEAMACGCPVVASDLAVLREVGGPAASYCPVADIAAWHQTLMPLLNERLQLPGSWELRRQQGIAWARRFSWAENARQTAGLYRKVMENAK